MNIGIIGAGKVGFSLALYFNCHGQRVHGVYSLHHDSAKELSSRCRCLVYDDLSALAQNSDILFFTVPDGKIAEVFGSIPKNILENRIVCHCSGSLSAADTFGSENTSYFKASVHPLGAISDRNKGFEELGDIYFCIEGDDKAVEALSALMTESGLKLRRISSDKKVMYHLAAATASNLVLGVIASAVSLFENCGFKKDEAIPLLSPLIEGNIRHILKDGLVNSLTGPVQRGDTRTVQRHLEVLSKPEDKKLYALLSLKLLEIAKEKSPDKDFSQLELLLKNNI